MNVPQPPFQAWKQRSDAQLDLTAPIVSRFQQWHDEHPEEMFVLRELMQMLLNEISSAAERRRAKKQADAFLKEALAKIDEFTGNSDERRLLIWKLVAGLYPRVSSDAMQRWNHSSVEPYQQHIQESRQTQA